MFLSLGCFDQLGQDKSVPVVQLNIMSCSVRLGQLFLNSIFVLLGRGVKKTIWRGEGTKDRFVEGKECKYLHNLVYLQNNWGGGVNTIIRCYALGHYVISLFKTSFTSVMIDDNGHGEVRRRVVVVFARRISFR